MLTKSPPSAKTVAINLTFLIFAVLLALTTPAQDLNGFRLDKSKPEVCRILAEHPTYRLRGEGKCPDLPDRIVVEVPQPTMPSITVVILAFDHRGKVGAIWSKFPSTDFVAIYKAAMKNYGQATSLHEYLPGKGGVTYPNRIAYWHTNAADIYLEERNTVERNGELTGWLAINSPVPRAADPVASF